MDIKESNLDPATADRRITVLAGDYLLHTIKAGDTVRLVDVEGNQAADTLFFNANDPHERYSAVDTIREQANVYLGPGTTIERR